MELGCGIGWLSNSIAYYYGSKVVAVDYNKVAIEFAKSLSKLLDINVGFICDDLFSYENENFDVVISNGVLHHTGDIKGGISKCASMVKPGGKLFLGLYHKYGRKPFLDYF